ncbi:MAG: SDR family oxidoreductase [Rhodobacteraceae bacterium]|nr:SDR family oxidoreductase [Paracoccaceae bacterium]
MKTLLSFGHGYSSQALAEILVQQGWRVIGTSRTPGKRRQQGVEMIPFPGTDMAPHLAAATHILISAAPDKTGDPVLQEFGAHIAAGAYEWLGYLSTTGVYGDHQGAWVDEDTPLTPATTRGRWRVAGETAWRIAHRNTHIFRLAGIYGPGRGPFSKLRNGTARRIIKEGQVFSRIHRDDIARVLAASIARPNPGRAYNLCDNMPAPPEDVIGYAAKLLGLPLPPAEPFETAEMLPMARSFYSENKRIKNDRIKDELGVSLKYPDYRAGLESLLAAVERG